MTKNNFYKIMLRAIGAICLLLASMSLYSGLSYGVQIGIAGYVLGAIILVASAAFGLEKDVIVSKANRMMRAGAVILVTIILHIFGVWTMSHVNWILGMALILFGFANLLFITPTVNGFGSN